MCRTRISGVNLVLEQGQVVHVGDRRKMSRHIVVESCDMFSIDQLEEMDSALCSNCIILYNSMYDHERIPCSGCTQPREAMKL